MCADVPERPTGDGGRRDDAGPATPAEEVADLLHRTTHRLRRAMRDDAGPGALTPAQWRALRVVAGCGEPPRMSAVADRLRIARRSATAVVDDLEDRGLVRRDADPGDRRAVVVVLTDAGVAALGEGRRRRRRAAARALEVLDDRDLAALAALLRRLDET